MNRLQTSTNKTMETNLTVEKNDPRLCLTGTDHLWSVVNRRECGNLSVADVLAENVEHADAVMFAAAPDLLAALRGLMTQAVKDAESYAEDDSEAIWAWIEDAKDAIAKATGKGEA